jgi:hypothetical protein
VYTIRVFHPTTILLLHNIESDFHIARGNLAPGLYDVADAFEGDEDDEGHTILEVDGQWMVLPNDSFAKIHSLGFSAN